MNYKSFLLFNLIISSNIFFACEKSITIANKFNYRLANKEDLPQLLEIINSQAIHDKDKIVIAPKKFREMILLSAIEKRRIFIAEERGKIIAYKKLFIIKDDSEKKEILDKEIRCVNNEAGKSFEGIISKDNVIIEKFIELDNKECVGILIYNGADFTIPQYRLQGINQQLTNFALISLIDNILGLISHANFKAQAALLTKNITLFMIYGITKENAGEYPGAQSDRTLSISKSFKLLLQNLENNTLPIELYHKRYIAFKPSFDADSSTLEPLSDDKSIPGFGCILAYKLSK